MYKLSAIDNDKIISKRHHNIDLKHQYLQGSCKRSLDRDAIR